MANVTASLPSSMHGHTCRKNTIPNLRAGLRLCSPKSFLSDSVRSLFTFPFFSPCLCHPNRCLDGLPVQPAGCQLVSYPAACQAKPDQARRLQHNDNLSLFSPVENSVVCHPLDFFLQFSHSSHNPVKKQRGRFLASVYILFADVLYILNKNYFTILI